MQSNKVSSVDEAVDMITEATQEIQDVLDAGGKAFAVISSIIDGKIPHVEFIPNAKHNNMLEK